MVPPETVFSRVPRFPALTGTVIDSTPPVTVTVADVSAAQAAPARLNVSIPVAPSTSRARPRLLFMAIPSPQLSGEAMDPEEWRPRFLGAAHRERRGGRCAKPKAFDASFP